MSKIAFVFSGQGAQYSGMGKELCESSKAASELFSLAESKISGLMDMCFTADKETLSKTVNTQPCLLAVDLAAAYALAESGVKPSAIAGFSLGEIAALAFSRAISDEFAFDFIKDRAQYMHDCTMQGVGLMYAVLGLSSSVVNEICGNIERCYPVNYNCATQTVVACSENSSAKLLDAVKEAGGKTMKLAVSGAFHSPFMQDAGTKLAKKYENIKFSNFEIPVYANTTAKPYENENQLFTQVSSPVKWQETVENMINDGIDTFVEVGAGKTLQGLIKKIDSSVTVLGVENKETLQHAMEVLGGK